MAVEHPELASRDPGQPVDAQYEWFATNALFTAETLFVLVGDDPRWKNSIAFIVRQHRGYLEDGHFICGNFSSGFVTYVTDEIKDLKCAR